MNEKLNIYIQFILCNPFCFKSAVLLTTSREPRISERMEVRSWTRNQLPPSVSYLAFPLPSCSTGLAILTHRHLYPFPLLPSPKTEKRTLSFPPTPACPGDDPSLPGRWSK